MLAHKRHKNPIPVVNGETGEVVGSAAPAKIVGAWLEGNQTPFIRFGGKKVACTTDDEDNPTEIRIYPSKDIYPPP